MSDEGLDPTTIGTEQDHPNDESYVLLLNRAIVYYSEMSRELRAEVARLTADLAAERKACDVLREDHVWAGHGESICQTWPARDMRCPKCKAHDARRAAECAKVPDGTAKPHGRRAWTINFGIRPFIDVSVMPRSGAVSNRDHVTPASQGDNPSESET